MGKTKKLRSTSHKKQMPPTGGPTRAEIEAAQEDYSMMEPDDAQVFKGLVDLQGSVREATCVALATMFGDIVDNDEQEKKIREKLQKMVDAGLLKKLIPRMVDPMKMVRLHALGALRNISVTGGLEICELLTTQNVITPLVKLISENATDENFEQNDLHAMQLLEQAVALLANLCESCQGAINELTQGNLLDPIMRIAAKGRTHLALHLETLKLLLLITESNPTLNEIFGQNSAYQQMIGDIVRSDQETLHVRLLAVGIAMNVRAIMQVEANVAQLLPIIERALAFDAVTVVQLAQQVTENWQLVQQSVLDDKDVDDDTLTAEEEQQIMNAQMKYRTWKDNVQTLNLALELVADLAITGDDNEAEEEWGSDDEDAMEEYAATHMEMGELSLGGGSPVASALSASQIFSLCVAILQGLVSIPPLPVRVIAYDFEKMRIRVCNALNNLLQTVSWEVMGDNVVPQVFRHFCTLYGNVKTESSAQPFNFESSSTNDIEVAATSAMWSALRRASSEGKDLVITPDDANLIMTSALQSQSTETRMNTVGMIGCVGKRSKVSQEIEVIGRCLLSALNDASVEVVAEALNAVFDVYGDETFDDSFRNLQFLSGLERTSTSLKAKIRAEQKQMDRDLVAHLKETQLNLVRFIKYKKKHL